MRFTLQFTANYVGANYGIIKQTVFKSESVDKAYEKQKTLLDEFLKDKKSECGFTGAFIGYTLKLWENEIEFETKGTDFIDSKDSFKLQVIGWYDNDGNFHKGDPKIENPMKKDIEDIIKNSSSTGITCIMDDYPTIDLTEKPRGSKGFNKKYN